MFSMTIASRMHSWSPDPMASRFHSGLSARDYMHVAPFLVMHLLTHGHSSVWLMTERKNTQNESTVMPCWHDAYRILLCSQASEHTTKSGLKPTSKLSCDSSGHLSCQLHPRKEHLCTEGQNSLSTGHTHIRKNRRSSTWHPTMFSASHACYRHNVCQQDPIFGHHIQRTQIQDEQGAKEPACSHCHHGDQKCAAAVSLQRIQRHWE
jgi:hypothetical protein